MKSKELNELETKVNTEHEALAKLMLEMIMLRDRGEEGKISEERKNEIKQHLAQED